MIKLNSRLRLDDEGELDDGGHQAQIAAALGREATTMLNMLLDRSLARLLPEHSLEAAPPKSVEGSRFAGGSSLAVRTDGT